MMSAVRQMIEKCLSGLPLRQLVRLSVAQPLSIFFHTIFEEVPPYFSGLYRVPTPREFAAEMDQLLSVFEPVSLDDLLSAEVDSDLPRNSFFLSFDDGYREIAELIAPILNRKGIPATFFICSSFVDNQNWFFEDQLALIRHRMKTASGVQRTAVDACLAEHGYAWQTIAVARRPEPSLLRRCGGILEIDWQHELNTWQPYVTRDQIRGLQNQGFSIGAHSVDHSLFESLDEDAQLNQVRESCDFFVNEFDVQQKLFAFPYGEFGVKRETLESMISSGAADHLFGTRGLISDELHPRVHQRLWCEDYDGSLTGHLKRNLAKRTLRNWRNRDMVVRRDHSA